MAEVIDDSAQGMQCLSRLVGSFAIFAALLSALGIYGVLSYAVSQRTREIGIRLSLGASRGRVLSQMLGEGMRLAAAGLAIGMAGALAAGKVMANLLHEVTPKDPNVLSATTGLLAENIARATPSVGIGFCSLLRIVLSDSPPLRRGVYLQWTVCRLSVESKCRFACADSRRYPLILVVDSVSFYECRVTRTEKDTSPVWKLQVAKNQDEP